MQTKVTTNKKKKDMVGTLGLLHKNKKKKADFDVEFSL